MKESNGGNLTFRLYCDDDLPDVLGLWADAGWGELTREQWHTWFMQTPYGSCVVPVAVDELGRIAGQAVFTPSRVVVDDTEVAGLRISSPILRKDLRQSAASIAHPFIGLYRAGLRAGAKRGYRIVYGLPEQSWLPLLRRIARAPEVARLVPGHDGNDRPWVAHLAEFPCLEANADELSFGDDRLRAQPITEFDEEFEHVWSQACSSFQFGCGVVRESTWLKYRNGGRFCVEVRDTHNGSLVGYAAFKKNSGLLLDLMAREPSYLAPVLLAAIQCAVAFGNGDRPTTFKAMGTPYLRPAAESLGFRPVEFGFAFLCDAIDPSLFDKLEPNDWYIMPGD